MTLRDVEAGPRRAERGSYTEPILPFQVSSGRFLFPALEPRRGERRSRQELSLLRDDKLELSLLRDDKAMLAHVRDDRV